MKTGLLKRGFLGVACALALLVSLPFMALADDGPQPVGDAKCTFELTGYEWGGRIYSGSLVKADASSPIVGSPSWEIFNDDSFKDPSTGRFKADQPYYLKVSFISAEDYSDAALVFNGKSCDKLSFSQEQADSNNYFYVVCFELPELEIVPFPISFTKEVEQTGDVAPGKGEFELEVLNVYEGSNSPISNFEIDSSFSTEGAGLVSKCFTVKAKSGDFDDVVRLLEEGVLVSEKNLGAEGWTYDDAVWLVQLAPDLASQTDGLQGSPSVFERYLDRLVFYKVKVIGGEFAFDSDDPATEMVFTNSYNESDPVISLTLPFVKKVVQGGALAPGKETFELEIFGIGNSGKDGYADVAYAATVETNGEGDFEGELTITGPASQVDSFVCEGFFVREAKGAAENWTYSDAVWFVSREWVEPGEVAFTPTLGDAAGNGGPGAEAEPQMALVVYPTTCEADEQGEKRYVPAEESVDKMVFENVYTAAEPAALAQTGDGANAGLLAALLLASGLGAAGAACGARRRLAERA